MKKLLVLGARQHAKVLISMLREFHAKQFECAGCLDDDPKLKGTDLLSIPVLGPLSMLRELKPKADGVLVGISNRFMRLREQLFAEAVELGFETPNVIHPRACVSADAKIGRGVVLNPGVVVNAFAAVGDNCVCYSNAVIEHETRLGNNVYIGPGTAFSSNARVGSNTFIGAGSRVIPDIKIGARVIVGAGAVVLADLPDDCTAVGAPARIVRNEGTFAEETRF